MIKTQGFKRFPAIRCWIKHLLEGRYVNEDKTLLTIFGKAKRVRFVATIIEKREVMATKLSNDDNSFDEEGGPDLRFEMDLDDGTGLIRAIIWRADLEKYRKFEKGDIVDIVGLIRYWNGYVSISPEIINKVQDSNFILLRDVDIIKKIRSGGTQEIPDILDEEIQINEISEDIDVDILFSEGDSEEIDELKENVYSLIENYSLEGNGIKFNDLKKILKISEEKLRGYIRDLEMESRIYQSQENIYQSY
jgi:RPA family protein